MQQQQRDSSAKATRTVAHVVQECGAPIDALALESPPLRQLPRTAKAPSASPQDSVGHALVDQVLEVYADVGRRLGADAQPACEGSPLLTSERSSCEAAPLDIPLHQPIWHPQPTPRRIDPQPTPRLIDQQPTPRRVDARVGAGPRGVQLSPVPVRRSRCLSFALVCCTLELEQPGTHR